MSTYEGNVENQLGNRQSTHRENLQMRSMNECNEKNSVSGYLSESQLYLTSNFKILVYLIFKFIFFFVFSPCIQTQQN